MRELSVLFSDVRGFSGISEGLSAQELTKLINDLMTPMADTIIDYNGTIDKFIGDAIMAFWNAPIDDPDHARNACQAALAMRRALADFNAERLRAQPDAVPLDMGIGINTGPCCVGNLGTETRFDYSAIGDAVNVASRLEGETKAVGAPIIIGEETHRLVPEMAALEIGTVVVKGRKGESRIFALLGDEEFARGPDFAELERLHGLLAAAAQNGDAGEARRLAEAFDAAGGDRTGTLADHYVGLAEKRSAA
jgi:adenylate cyclase